MPQNAPVYAYIPAKDFARARNFHESKLGFKAKEVTAGGVTPVTAVTGEPRAVAAQS